MTRVRSLRGYDPVEKPYASSADVWEAVYRTTARPIVADFYSRLCPLEKLTFDRVPLFDALCAAGDMLGTRWTEDNGFLLCRSASYYWDKLKEVPNRLLTRWSTARQSRPSK